MNDPDIHFKRLTAANVRQVCSLPWSVAVQGLSETLSAQQRTMVADNAVSIAQAYCSDNVWLRAIYAGDTPVGFLMLHIGSDYEDGIDCAGVFLWRLMIAAPFQGKGYGKLAMQRLFAHLRAQGSAELYTSCGVGEGSPEGFYRKLGFAPTGERYDDEIELVLKLT